MPLKASPEDQRTLLDLQEQDTSIRQLEHRARTIANDPELNAIDDKLVELDRAVLDKLGAVDDLTAEVARVESDVKVVEARAQRDRERVAGVSDPKTAAAIEHEIASLDKRRSDLEDIELEVMERLEGAESELLQARANASTTRDERSRLAASFDDAARLVDAQLQEVRDERGRIAATVPEALLALYERQRERYGAGASHLHRRTSSASGVELTAAELAEVRSAADDDVLLCPSSSAILVRTEDSGI